MGPTASGKTDLACRLVQDFPLEIISVDSAMIYRGMDIGTAKPDSQILAQAPHHLLDIIDPPESYSAARFCDDVSRLSKEIVACGKYPLLVGGTMMYFRALQQGLSVLPPANEDIRNQLLQDAQTRGWDFLHQQLLTIDPGSAARIHPHDTQRLQRALEVYLATGTTLTEHLKSQTAVGVYQFVNLTLMPTDRSWLHARIACRFEQMLAQGLISEVEQLLSKWHLTASNPAMRSVGYRQVISYLSNEYDYTTLCIKGVAATRQLAKRQLTWLRHWPHAYNFEADNPKSGAEIMALIRQILDNHP